MCQSVQIPQWRRQLIAWRDRCTSDSCHKRSHNHHRRGGKDRLQALSNSACSPERRKKINCFRCFSLRILWDYKKKETYFFPIVNRGRLVAFTADFNLRASPSFSVTTHSFTLPASNKPMKVPFVRWSDMTFSKRIQNTTKWSDLRVHKRKYVR